MVEMMDEQERAQNLCISRECNAALAVAALQGALFGVTESGEFVLPADHEINIVEEAA